MNNLSDKGRLTKTREGKATFFAPAKSREEFEADVVSSVVSSLKRNYGSGVIASWSTSLSSTRKLAEFERVIALRKSELKR